MMCTLLTTGDGVPGRIAPVLVQFFGATTDEVDVCDAWDLDSRNWDAPVSCEYTPLSGDLSWSLAISTAEDTPHLSEEGLALTVARSLGVVVVFSSEYPDISWIDRAATPAGEVGYISTTEAEGDPPRWTVEISEIRIPAFPHAEVRHIPEIIKPLQLPTPSPMCASRRNTRNEACAIPWSTGNGSRSVWQRTGLRRRGTRPPCTWRISNCAIRSPM